MRDLECAEAVATQRARRTIPLTSGELKWLGCAGGDLRAIFDAAATSQRNCKRCYAHRLPAICLTVDREASTADLQITWERGANTHAEGPKAAFPHEATAPPPAHSAPPTAWPCPPTRPPNPRARRRRVPRVRRGDRGQRPVLGHLPNPDHNADVDAPVSRRVGQRELPETASTPSSHLLGQGPQKRPKDLG